MLGRHPLAFPGIGAELRVARRAEVACRAHIDVLVAAELRLAALLLAHVADERGLLLLLLLLLLRRRRRSSLFGRPTARIGSGAYAEGREALHHVHAAYARLAHRKGGGTGLVRDPPPPVDAPERPAGPLERAREQRLREVVVGGDLRAGEVAAEKVFGDGELRGEVRDRVALEEERLELWPAQRPRARHARQLRQLVVAHQQKLQHRAARGQRRGQAGQLVGSEGQAAEARRGEEVVLVDGRDPVVVHLEDLQRVALGRRQRRHRLEVVVEEAQLAERRAARQRAELDKAVVVQVEHADVGPAGDIRQRHHLVGRQVHLLQRRKLAEVRWQTGDGIVECVQHLQRAKRAELLGKGLQAVLVEQELLELLALVQLRRQRGQPIVAAVEHKQPREGAEEWRQLL